MSSLAAVKKPNRNRTPRSKGGKNIIDVAVEMPDNLEDMLIDLEPKIRLNEIERALRKAGKVVAQNARTRITAPGYPGDKTKKNPRLTPLRKSITWVTRQKGKTVTCYVGPEYSGNGTGGGNHGHLVEFGHRLVRDGKQIGMVPPKPFLRPAALATQSEQTSIIVQHLKDAVK